MAEIKLTSAADTYVQPASDKNLVNNVYGEEGNDLIRMYQGFAVGGKGDDRLEKIVDPNLPNAIFQAGYWTSPSGIQVNLAEGWAKDGFGGTDTLVGVTRVHGSFYDDNIVGDAANNGYAAQHGHDTFDGGAGIDTVTPWFLPVGERNLRGARLDELDIRVSADGRLAKVTTKVGAGFSLTLIDVERIDLTQPDGSVSARLLTDFITPQSLAEDVLVAGEALRWNAAAPLGSSISLSYSFVTQAPASGPGAAGFRAFTPDEQAAVRAILAGLQQSTGMSFAEVADTAAAAGQLRFGVSQQATTRGVTMLPNQPGAGDQAGDVWMDVDSMLALSPGTEGYATLLHEIGHALGLRHPRNIDASDNWSLQARIADDRTALTVMSQTPSADGLWPRDWGSLDLLALRYLYGSRSVNAGDNTYTLGSVQAHAQTTLVDDGGRDTLDASASPLGVSIDLVPGHLSSFGLSAAGIAGSQNVGIAGDSWIENAIGTSMDDVLLGNRLDNRLTGGRGNDWLDGAEGRDTAVFAGTRASYGVSSSFGVFYVASADGASGFDTLLNIERLQFDDRAVALDMAGAAGQTAQILRALFGPAALKTAEFAGYGVGLLDSGMGFDALVGMAIASDAFLALAGSRSNADFVRLVYRNVVGSPVPADALALYTGMLDSGAQTQQSLAVLACRLDINTQSAELLGLASTGLDYLLPPGW